MTTNGRSSGVLRQFDRLYGQGTVAGLDERVLLERFVSRKDDAAFEALVTRFGPMVLGVCRRSLADSHDIEDAFQATFLILVKKANTIRDGDRLGNWLYGVAYKVAVRARRRQSREVPGLDEIAVTPRITLDSDRAELEAVLDEELSRLPEKYRAPLVLCNLQGETYEEAARRLKCPIGTIRSRTSKARELLRARLTRRGFAPSAIVMEPVSRVVVPPALLKATITAAQGLAAKGMSAGVVSASVVVLTREVLRAMLFSKVQWAVVTFGVVVASASGVGVVAAGFRGDGPVVAQNGGEAIAQDTRKPAETGSDDKARIKELERRLQDLERKLDETRTGSDRQSLKAPESAENIIKVRTRFDCLLKQIPVKVGQTVKKGDALVEVFSTDLAAAKNDFLTKSVQWKHDKRLYDLREKLVKNGAISQQLWVDTQNEMRKSELDLNLVRDKLSLLFEVSDEDINAIMGAPAEKKAQYTIRSKVDGKVLRINASAQDFAEENEVLMLIEPSIEKGIDAGSQGRAGAKDPLDFVAGVQFTKESKPLDRVSEIPGKDLPVDQVVAALYLDRIEAANQVRDMTYKLFRGGEVPLSKLFEARDRYTSAILDAPLTDDEKIRLFKEELKGTTKLELFVQELYKKEQNTRADVKLAEFYRLDTALMLIEAEMMQKVDPRERVTFDKRDPTQANSIYKQFVKILNNQDLGFILKKSISLDYPNPTRLSVVISKLREFADQAVIQGESIAFDPEGLKKSNVTMDTKITLPKTTCTLAEALKKVLEPIGLTYRIKDGLIWISTP